MQKEILKIYAPQNMSKILAHPKTLAKNAKKLAHPKY
jgi:hypothetical protein